MTDASHQPAAPRTIWLRCPPGTPATWEALRHCAQSQVAEGLVVPLASLPALEPVGSTSPAPAIAAVQTYAPTSGAAEGAARIRAELGRAQAVGAQLLLVRLPRFDELTPQAGQRYAAGLNLLHELLAATYFDAECAGVRLAIEPVTAGWLLSPVECREVVDAVSSAAIGVVLDAEAVDAVGALPDWLVTLGRRVLAVSIAGWTGPTNEGSVAESDSQATWPSRLDAAGYAGPVIVPASV